MALQKQPINIPFGQGISTKADAKQVPMGQWLALYNTVFNQDGLLQKRNGFTQITNLPTGTIASSLCTYNGGLVAIGASLTAYDAQTNAWYTRGVLPAVDLQVQPTVRTNSSKTSSDVAISPSGLVCTVYHDGTGCYYQVTSVTGELVLPPVFISATSTLPRVFTLNSHFIVTFLDVVSATTHLQYIAVPLGNAANPSAATDISTQAKTAGDYDGVVANGRVYLIWNGSDGGGAVRFTYITNQLVISSPTVLATEIADVAAIGVDNTQSIPNLYLLFYKTASTTLKVAIYNANMTQILAPTAVDTTNTISHITLTAANNVAKVYYEVVNTYAYDGAIQTNFIASQTVTTAGIIGSQVIIKRGLGLASKALTINSIDYFLGAYGQASTSSQPSYFFIDASGNVVCKIAYSNGAGYNTTTVLSQLLSYNSNYYLSYLFRDQIVAVNKTQGLAGIVNGVYAQNGVNLAKLTFNAQQYTAEIGNNLHITGGLLWTFDGVSPVEQGFNVWPENVEATWSATGGSMAAKPDGSTNTNAYYYQVTYEWTDAAGNLHRSAPSLPVAVTTTGALSTGSVAVKVPTLRLTTKASVRIVGYRWSVAQQSYYQFTSIASPTLNDTTADYVTITDTLADASILGNTLLYTTGGVIEDIASPAAAALTLFKNRLFILDAEDRNLLWYSKQVIEATPVELSDLLTMYIAPTIGSQGSTGPVTAISSLDDKLIIFKQNAIYYVTGTGPDNTGANNDFSDPVFITSVVGCTNPSSIVFTPQGLQFQSDKGIWLLGRDLSTSYIGAPAQVYNSDLVKSSLGIPGTNQVRFNLTSGTVLMYDFVQNQWGPFSGISGISSTLYNGLHTYLDSNSRIYQETPGLYLDGSNPVLISLTSAWIKLTGLQGFQRAYWFYLLGSYLSPHKLNVGISYDYNPAIAHSTLVTPTNTPSTWGDDALWGSSTPWGGGDSVEQARVFFQRGKCQAIQITINEIYDPSFGIAAGAGLTLSGLNVIVGAKKGYPTLPGAKSYG